MVGLLEMAKLMDDYVVLQALRQSNYFPIEIEIGVAGATSPARLLVTDKDPIPAETIVPIPIA